MSSAQYRKSFETYRDAVYGWAFRVLRDHHDALDVTQEVFVKWWRAHRNDDQPRHAVAWLRRVTVNHSINLCKSRARFRGSDVAHEAVAATPPADIERREIASAVTEALSDVTEQQRSVLFAKVYDGCTFAEIARQMDLAVPTVKTHYLRAIRSARRKLEEAGLLTGETR